MKSIFLSLLLAVAISAPVIAQTVPSGMTYQGRLTDANNAPVPDGTGYQLEVRLWNVGAGGPNPILLWGSRYSSVPVKNGAFNLILGIGGEAIQGALYADLKTAFTNNPSVHLGLKMTKRADGADVNASEILPRQQIFSTPFAFRAETTASVQPDGVDSTAIRDGSIQSADLAATLKAQLDQLTPSGSVMAFAGANAPAGWLKCDGSQVSRSQYPNLFAAIGTSHGTGDGSASFHLPDYRGRFLRGVNESATKDPDASSRAAMAPGGSTGNTVGSVQEDEFKSHFHVVQDGNFGDTLGVFAFGGRGTVNGETSNQTDPSGGSETRPKNAYVTFIIKF